MDYISVFSKHLGKLIAVPAGPNISLSSWSESDSMWENYVGWLEEGWNNDSWIEHGWCNGSTWMENGWNDTDTWSNGFSSDDSWSNGK